ncbi:sulfatase family protein [Spirosoma endbachense]|uniref:Sulfatase-like hydrolase/transferase n=1 Tax=Spirosoma endbachense TaxID=2666025 RepID=A0A6P1W963_9BACT|nr:sulfatase [Spirosoma endbachense]QHW00550.1 sulfatase-like hydrolase/transferase [Spirosoma endbachense]
MIRPFIFRTLFGLLVLVGLLLALPGYIVPYEERFNAPKPTRPNVIFIISDDHTSQAISAYGSKLAKTPNIDRIAREGAILYNNVVANSICGPSRATLLTGQYSHRNGYKLNEKVFDINQPVFSEELQKNGYQTAWIGKMHLGSLPHGFDYLNILPGHGSYYNSDFVDSNNKTTRHPGYVTDVVTGLSTDWLDKRDATKPFFLVVGHKATHREWMPALEDLGAYDTVTFPIPPTFYDTYTGRLAAQQQDMSIEKTMSLQADLKVHVEYEVDEAKVPQEKARLKKMLYGDAEPTPEQDQQLDTYVREGSYKRLTPEQKKAFSAYYAKISQEFDQKKLTGKALTEWKYQRYLKDYLSTANSLDRNIGKLLAYLDKRGLAKNTVVIYTSDQGFYLGEHGWFDKRWIYEESLKTPFVIRYPGVIKPGSQVKQVVSNVDWAPTLLSLTNTPIPAYIQGESFLPVLTGSTKAWRDRAYYHYYEYPQPHHVSPHFGLRTNHYTLARFYGPANFWELYDIQKDPHNLHNLYGQKGYETLTAGLKQQLKREIVKYKDEEALKLMDSVPK